MIVGSTCSGILADAVAWSALGWKHAWCAEWVPTDASDSERLLSAFNCRLIAERHPTIPNLGDFTKIGTDRGSGIDLLMGGTPCQDFSVAGLRAGLDGARGALALEFLRLADRLAPRWIVWENVPGVLHASGGRAMGAFLGGLSELGYGFAYRVLDAQFFGLAQRRKRVFVVARAGGQWQRAAAVLLERSGLRGDPAPSREAGSAVAGCLEARARSGGHDVGAHGAASGHLVAGDTGGTRARDRRVDDVVGTLTTGAHVRGRLGVDEVAAGHVVAHTLRATGADASEDGSGRGTPLVVGTLGKRHNLAGSIDGVAAHQIIPIQDPRGRRDQGGSGIRADGAPSYTLESHAPGVAILPFDTTQITHPENRSRPEHGDPSPSLGKGTHAPAIAFHQTQDPIHGDVSPALGRKSMGMGMGMGSTVRRLTPTECERLMGFADGYTAIKDATDGHRYAALGNSIAVPVLRWIGERIAIVDAMELVR